MVLKIIYGLQLLMWITYEKSNRYTKSHDEDTEDFLRKRAPKRTPLGIRMRMGHPLGIHMQMGPIMCSIFFRFFPMEEFHHGIQMRMGHRLTSSCGRLILHLAYFSNFASKVIDPWHSHVDESPLRNPHADSLY